MASIKYVVPFTKQWEGGLSRATTDKASANPSPWTYKGVTGWHTNRGITYTTFVSNAAKLCYAITPENFFLMPDEIWMKIAKQIYWDGLLLDQVRSEAIAAALFNWIWGSGDYGAGHSLEKFLYEKYKIVATTDAQQVAAINKLTLTQGEENLFLQLIDWREQFFISLNQPLNLDGWLNRLKNGSGTGAKRKESMLEFGLNLIKKKKLKIIAVALGIIIIVSITFYLLKKQK